MWNSNLDSEDMEKRARRARIGINGEGRGNSNMGNGADLKKGVNLQNLYCESKLGLKERLERDSGFRSTLLEQPAQGQIISIKVTDMKDNEVDDEVFEASTGRK